MELEVELRDQIAQKVVVIGNKKTVVDVNMRQFSVMVNGKEIGLVCEAPESPINFLPVANNYPPEALEKVAEAVRGELAKRGDASTRVMAPPPDQESVAEAEVMQANLASQEGSVADPVDENNL